MDKSVIRISATSPDKHRSAANSFHIKMHILLFIDASKDQKKTAMVTNRITAELLEQGHAVTTFGKSEYLLQTPSNALVLPFCSILKTTAFLLDKHYFKVENELYCPCLICYNYGVFLGSARVSREALYLHLGITSWQEGLKLNHQTNSIL